MIQFFIFKEAILVDFEYCYKRCPAGKKASEELLEKNESVFDAINDFWVFTNECFKTCPYKDKHTKEKTQ
jgi:hypothetical protein